MRSNRTPILTSCGEDSSRKSSSIPTVSLAQDNRHRLVVGLDDYAHGAPLLEINQGYGEADDHCALDFLAGLQLVFGSESGLRILFQGGKSLIVAIEIHGGHRVAA